MSYKTKQTLFKTLIAASLILLGSILPVSTAYAVSSDMGVDVAHENP